MGNVRIIDDFGLEAQLPGPEDTGPMELRRVREQAPADEEQAGEEGEGGLGSLTVWIGSGAAVVLLAAGWMILRRKRQPTGS